MDSEFFIKPDITPPPFQISHADELLLIGSCFTSNVGRQLEDLKFRVSHNPGGILFDPFSVVRQLREAVEKKEYTHEDLVCRDEIWHSFNFHTDFSSTSPEVIMDRINQALQQMAESIRRADVLFITLGSAFYYSLADSGKEVANCHRFPAATFSKQLASSLNIINRFALLIADFKRINPKLKWVFTVSPVRHIREGVVNNNRSKARLIEAVHELCDLHENVYYFPAYELVIDVLRDYRFYDVDLVHPNFAATRFVFEQFKQSFFSPETLQLCEQVREVVTAFRHKPNFPDTEAHRKFLASQLSKIQQIEPLLPNTDWLAEKRYFGDGV